MNATSDMTRDRTHLERCLKHDEKSVRAGGFPVGAAVVVEDVVIATGQSDGAQQCDATHHAEIAALRAASIALEKRDLTGATVCTSMEPCLMCLCACHWAGVSRLVFACGREQLSAQHFEGRHDLYTINAQNRRPLQLVHVPELEPAALETVSKWEAQRVIARDDVGKN